MATVLKEGDKAPLFKSKDQNENEISSENMKGKKIILYFYPRDNTPGCTAEACSLRDGYDELLKAGFVVIGVSPDNEKSHQKFSKQHNLPFHLIADKDKELISSYGVWGEKKMLGKTYMGVIRTTFIISEDGLIEHIIPRVDTKNHAGQILELYKK
jgi:thioredoxin-dependent peroxiredoxin